MIYLHILKYQKHKTRVTISLTHSIISNFQLFCQTFKLMITIHLSRENMVSKLRIMSETDSMKYIHTSCELLRHNHHEVCNFLKKFHVQNMISHENQTSLSLIVWYPNYFKLKIRNMHKQIF